MKPVIEQIEEVVGDYKIIAWHDENGFAGLISGKNYLMGIPEANDGSRLQSLKHVINQARIFLGFHEVAKNELV